MDKTILAFYTTGRRAVLIMANESEEKRQRFLRAACEVAVTKGDPSASVHVHEAAEVMGMKFRDEVPGRRRPGRADEHDRGSSGGR